MSVAFNILHIFESRKAGNCFIMLFCRFPTPEKAPKMGKFDESSVPQINKNVQQQSEVDEVVGLQF